MRPSPPSHLNNAGRDSEQVFANAKKERKQGGGQMGGKKKRGTSRWERLKQTEQGRGRKKEDRKSIKGPGQEYAPLL